MIIVHVKSGDRWIDGHGKRKAILGLAGKKATFAPPFCPYVTRGISYHAYSPCFSVLHVVGVACMGMRLTSCLLLCKYHTFATM